VSPGQHIERSKRMDAGHVVQLDDIHPLAWPAHAVRRRPIHHGGQSGHAEPPRARSAQRFRQRAGPLDGAPHRDRRIDREITQALQPSEGVMPLDEAAAGILTAQRGNLRVASNPNPGIAWLPPIAALDELRLE